MPDTPKVQLENALASYDGKLTDNQDLTLSTLEEALDAAKTAYYTIEMEYKSNQVRMSSAVLPEELKQLGHYFINKTAPLATALKRTREAQDDDNSDDKTREYVVQLMHRLLFSTQENLSHLIKHIAEVNSFYEQLDIVSLPAHEQGFASMMRANYAALKTSFETIDAGINSMRDSFIGR